VGQFRIPKSEVLGRRDGLAVQAEADVFDEIQDAIERAAPIGTRPGRYRPADTLLAFLERL